MSETPMTWPHDGREEIQRSVLFAHGTRIGAYVVHEPLQVLEREAVYSGSDISSGEDVLLHALGIEFEENDAELRRRCGDILRIQGVGHPNLLSVRSAEPRGRAVVVATDTFAGSTLREWCANQPPWADLVVVMTKVADAIAAAHDARVRHEDLTPERILVGTASEVRVYGFDFGSGTTCPVLPADMVLRGRRRPRYIWTQAKMQEYREAEDAVPHFVEPSPFARVWSGTIGYLPPESIWGVYGLGPDADQFSFGVTLFEALYGRRPFACDDLETYKDALGKRPSLPRDSDVPRWLGKIALKAMEGWTERRFRNMASVRDALATGPRRRWWPWP